jgi:hypothetical protein
MRLSEFMRNARRKGISKNAKEISDIRRRERAWASLLLV